ncbi:Uncharacterised protein g4965 [Pycnogonum litorale]
MSEIVSVNDGLSRSIKLNKGNIGKNRELQKLPLLTEVVSTKKERSLKEIIAEKEEKRRKESEARKAPVIESIMYCLLED